MDLENNIKEYLSSIEIDFDLPYETNYFQIFDDLLVIFEINPEITGELNESQLCLKYYIEITLQNRLKQLYKYFTNSEKVNELKKLKLPEQRTQEWYDMRKNKLTASSFADAIGKGHFKSRDEALLDKIVDTPFVMNPITEWGTKYEEIATRFYEYLTNSTIYEFGLIPHPDFPAFGASPDGICDTNSPPEYIGRMLEIKCPPKRKFTKNVPPHYWMQMQGQLEVCDLDECDFLQVKLDEYDNLDDYKTDSNGKIGFTKDDLPKGYTITFMKNGEPKYHYLYCPLFSSDEFILQWKQEKMNYLQENDFMFKEEKYWKITRYECTLVKRDKEWWNNSVKDIYKFYDDLLFFKKDDNVEILKKRILEKKSKKPVYHVQETFDEFCLISDEEN
mgnify:CR=1 FL=1